MVQLLSQMVTFSHSEHKQKDQSKINNRLLTTRPVNQKTRPPIQKYWAQAEIVPKNQRVAKLKTARDQQ